MAKCDRRHSIRLDYESIATSDKLIGELRLKKVVVINDEVPIELEAALRSSRACATSWFTRKIKSHIRAV